MLTLAAVEVDQERLRLAELADQVLAETEPLPQRPMERDQTPQPAPEAAEAVLRLSCLDRVRQEVLGPMALS
jgi:hypothetical protein